MAVNEADPRRINPGILNFLEVWDAKWASLRKEAEPAERRERFEEIAKEMLLPTPEGVSGDEEHWVDTPAGAVRVRVFRKAGEPARPVLIYMHGGGWMQGSPETHWDVTSRIAAWAGHDVVSVDYALAPERPYPAAFEQCLAVRKWVGEQASALRFDGTRVAIGGDSAGANLAAAVALKCRELTIPLTAQLLIYPPTDFDRTRPSYRENHDGPLLRVSGMATTNAYYCPDVDKLNSDPFISPLAAGDHSGLPPAYVAVAEYDPLRDSGLAYADAIEKAGVPVTRDMGTGMIHGYLRAMEYCLESEVSLRRMCEWLEKTAA